MKRILPFGSRVIVLTASSAGLLLVLASACDPGVSDSTGSTETGGGTNATGSGATASTGSHAAGGSGSHGTAGAGQGGSTGTMGGGGQTGSGGTQTGSGGTSGQGGAGGTPDFDGSTTGNPFTGANFYVNPWYVTEIQTSVSADPTDATLLEKVESFSTAIWITQISAVSGVETALEAARTEQNQKQMPVVTVFIVYDLPNRDCAAAASAGELTVTNNGLSKYKTNFIDPIVKSVKAHPKQRIVTIIEPDSLPNLVTNLGVQKCADAEATYKAGVAYAVEKLSAAGAFVYLDAGNAGWLGPTANQSAAATLYKGVLDTAGGVDKIRGFSSNVSNYEVLNAVTELYSYGTNPCHDELTYASQLSATFQGAGITNTNWIIDTSRDGLGGIRQNWGSWCNVVGAGIGARPLADPQAGIDAYYWVKAPGESDGTTDTSSPRYDPTCGNADATPGAPEAGVWFSSYFIALAKNANPAL